MLWDDRCLYVGAELEEPHVSATLTRHDAVIFNDNDFEMFLDPDGDSHRYGELELNALNTTWDLLLTRPYKDGGHAIDSWEIAGLRTAVHVEGTLNDPRDTDRGWSVEIAWPWEGVASLAAVPLPPRDGDQWRVNFSRVEWRYDVVGGGYRKVAGPREDNWVWSPQGVVDMHRPERWGYLQFSTAVPGTDHFRPDPSEPARRLLHQIYYAQHRYLGRHRGWAPSLAALGLAAPADPCCDAPQLKTTAEGFEASVTVRQAGATPRRWHIASDARVWSD
jgi:hypothetical protein